MKKKNTRYEISEETDWAFEPEDIMSVSIERNGCIYNWGIPYKTLKSISFQKLKEPYKEKDLLALGGVLVDILVLNKYSIDFKQKSGVQKLSVAIRSSESEDRQLLHKLISGLRAKDKELYKDTIPGTKNNDHE